MVPEVPTLETNVCCRQCGRPVGALVVRGELRLFDTLIGTDDGLTLAVAHVCPSGTRALSAAVTRCARCGRDIVIVQAEGLTAVASPVFPADDDTPLMVGPHYCGPADDRLGGVPRCHTAKLVTKWGVRRLVRRPRR